MAVGRAEHAAAADEPELIERARTDPEAFATLYRRHVDRIHRFALRRTGDPDLADDITAATFEKALAGLDRFRPGPAGIAPWLHRIAGNELADRYRRRGRERGERARRAADRMADPVAFDDHAHIDDADEALAIRHALDILNPRYQRVLTLRYLADLAHRDAAAAMGVPPSLFAVLVHRATAALRKALDHREEVRP